MKNQQNSHMQYCFKGNKEYVTTAFSLQSDSDFLYVLQKWDILQKAFLMDSFSEESSKLHSSNKNKLVAVSVSKEYAAENLG